MISEEEARDRILATISPFGSECIGLMDALDCFSAEEVRATVALPGFDNSAMDGYAVMAASAAKGARLRVIAEQPAGLAKNLTVDDGEAVRIFTGAPMPAGADAVVMQEETKRDGEFVIVQAQDVRDGDFVRKAGGDLARGQQILRPGERLSPAVLGLLASQGVTAAQVYRKAKMAIVTTGDEIVSPGAQLRAGEIFESNGVMSSALVKRAGAVVVANEHARDEFGDLCATLRRGTRADALIISGGVSVGERDLVRAALGEVGAEIDLWRVKIKPGKPFLFGRCGECALFGLPGNPVSSFITFLVFVRPALLRMMGAAEGELALPQSLARLAHDVAGDETRPHYLRGRFSDGVFSVIGRQESHALSGLARANALLRVAPGERFTIGSEVTVSLIP